MRDKIWKKEDFFLISGQRIDMDPAVVELPEEAPLAYGFDWSSDPLGKVTEIRLEDGEITGELTFFNPEFEAAMQELKDDVRLGGYYKDVERDRSGRTVLSCTLRSVSFVLLAGMPGYVRNEYK